MAYVCLISQRRLYRVAVTPSQLNTNKKNDCAEQTAVTTISVFWHASLCVRRLSFYTHMLTK